MCIYESSRQQRFEQNKLPEFMYLFDDNFLGICLSAIHDSIHQQINTIYRERTHLHHTHIVPCFDAGRYLVRTSIVYHIRSSLFR